MTKWLRPAAESWPGRFLSNLLRRYFIHDVGRQSAALAYYLLFMLFPFLIFLSSLLGLLDLDISGITRSLEALLPAGVLDVVETYLSYVSHTSSTAMLWFGLVFSIYFPMRATNSLMRSVRTAYHLGPPRGPARHMLKTLLYTVLLIVTIAAALALMTVGDRVLGYAVVHFRLPSFVAEAWARLRFPAVAVLCYFALFFLYAMAQDTRQPWRNIWPGTLAALAAWMALSWLYAFYVDNIANYSLLYGSIGTVIALLIWLNMSSVVLIMGAELNGTIMSLRKDGGGA